MLAEIHRVQPNILFIPTRMKCKSPWLLNKIIHVIMTHLRFLTKPFMKIPNMISDFFYGIVGTSCNFGKNIHFCYFGRFLPGYHGNQLLDTRTQMSNALAILTYLLTYLLAGPGLGCDQRSPLVRLHNACTQAYSQVHPRMGLVGLEMILIWDAVSISTNID